MNIIQEDFNIILLEVPTAFDRLQQRDFIGILDVHSNRYSVGDPRHAGSKRFQLIRQINGGGFSLDGRIGGKNDFLNAAELDAIDKLLRANIGRPYPVER